MSLKPHTLHHISIIIVLTCIFSTPSWQIPSIPINTYICRDLLATLYKDFVRSRNHFFFDLSLDTSLFLSQNTLISLQTCSSRILQAFSSFSLLGKLLILSHSCISCFETLVLGFFEKFWGFSKLMSFDWNFGIGFHLNVFKTSYIASH